MSNEGVVEVATQQFNGLGEAMAKLINQLKILEANHQAALKTVDELTTLVSAKQYEIDKLKAQVSDAKDARGKSEHTPTIDLLPNGDEKSEDSLFAKMMARKATLKEHGTVDLKREKTVNDIKALAANATKSAARPKVSASSLGDYYADV
jgi:hypothetical protein